MPQAATAPPASCRSRSTASSARRGDTDFFKFTAKKDQVFDINVYARRLRSPLDPVLVVCDAAGTASRPTTTPADRTAISASPRPPTASTRLRSTTTSSSGGPEYVYRVEVTPVAPKLTLAIPLVAANSQERQTIVVPTGTASPRWSARRARTSRGDVHARRRRTCPRA